MNARVLETWINETLRDAEHLDIPGVVLKPEQHTPVRRYGIHRDRLTGECGLSSELVDRIYRALFVYSVGFYELMQKAMEHSKERMAVVTAVWKVYSVLLEYCCRTDYRMLLTKITE